jgi:adenylate cyclase
MYGSLGFEPPDAEDHPRVDEPDLVTAAAVSLAAGIDPEALVRALRVYGESLRRMTRTETALWHDYIDVTAERSGASQRDILAMGADFGEAITSIIDNSTLAVYHRWQEHAWMGDLVEHIELALVEAGVYDKPDRPSTMAFMDLSGYTALTEERGDQAAADLATALASIVQRTAQQHAGEAMKFLGDGVMFRFRDPSSAVRGAMQVVHATVPAGLPPAHVGMHVGAVIERDGDVFGRTVNLASRISGKAGPGEVLVTQEIVDAADDGTLGFQSLGPVELKGVADPVSLFRAVVE